MSSATVLKFDRFKPDTAEKWLAHAQGNILAKGQLSEQGLPTPKLERWKFTNFAGALRKVDLDVTPSMVTLSGGYDFLSTEPVEYHLTNEPTLLMLNAAFVQEAKTISIPAGKRVENPIHLEWEGTEGSLQSDQFHIVVGDNAEATIIEHQRGQGVYWKNAALTIKIGKNARLRHYRFVDDDMLALETLHTSVDLARDALYEGFTLTIGGLFTCHETHIRLNGENAEAGIFGLSLLRGKQLGDTTIKIEHKAPHCRSNQFFKTVLGDQSHGVFQGKIHVDQIAQKTDGYQLSNNMLLSPLAEMNVKPELEIYADDVKCSHGTTTGQLDESPLFYLRSRGLPEQEARRLLIEAFLGEVVERVTSEDVRNQINEKVRTWLG